MILSSCGGKMIYFQKKKESKNDFSQIKVAQPNQVQNHIIEEGDVLQIRVFSDDKNLIETFNKNTLDAENSIVGYQVQNDGSIFIPFAGNVFVKGLTMNSAEKSLRDTLSYFTKIPNLVLDLVAFKVTVLGSVNKAGSVLVPTDNASIIDVLALTGDLTEFGNPNQIKVIRQKGVDKEIHILDLSDIDVFSDSFYYVQSNDIIYVEPLKRRFVKENVSYISIFATLLNTAVLINYRIALTK